MDYFAESLSQEGFKKLMALIDAKSQYMKENKLKAYPAVFEIGDEVGIYIQSPEPRHVFGRIYVHQGQTVDVQLADRQMKGVSLFEIFRTRPLGISEHWRHVN